MISRRVLRPWLIGLVLLAALAAFGAPAGCGTDSYTLLPGAGGAGAACAAGEKSCQGQCVDVTTDAKNCGACGADCGDGTCSAGACVCGDAGACGEGASCQGGACVCGAGLASCGEACADSEDRRGELRRLRQGLPRRTDLHRRRVQRLSGEHHRLRRPGRLRRSLQGRRQLRRLRRHLRRRGHVRRGHVRVPAGRELLRRHDGLRRRRHGSRQLRRLRQGLRARGVVQRRSVRLPRGPGRLRRPVRRSRVRPRVLRRLQHRVRARRGVLLRPLPVRAGAHHVQR